MSEVKHTPTPWFLVEDASGDSTEIVDVSFLKIATTTWSEQSHANIDEANAVHIVKCVNLHDELVEALKHIVDRSDNGTLGTSKVLDMKTIAVEALKKAGAL